MAESPGTYVANSTRLGLLLELLHQLVVHTRLNVHYVVKQMKRIMSAERNWIVHTADHHVHLDPAQQS